MGFAGLLSTTGCYGDCIPCGADEVGVWCKVGLQKHAICSASRALAEAECDNSGGVPASAPTCSGGVGGGDETSGNAAWDPLGAIAYDRGIDAYVIDRLFATALEADPNLLFLDATELAQSSSSGYYVVTAVGDLATAMGWQLGDQLVLVNGYQLQGLDDVLTAYFALSSETEFTLRLDRGGSMVSLQYVIQ
jgi:hypothetical protein